MDPVSLDPELAPGVINLLSERLKSLKEENERLKTENWNLRVIHGQISISDGGERDAKACTQQSCPSANRVKVLEEEIHAQDDLRQQIDTLQEEISALKAKYKKEKTARKESQSIRAEMEARLQGSLEEKCAAEQAREIIYQQLQAMKEYEASKNEGPVQQVMNRAYQSTVWRN
ncbi:hypothetical protein A0H81_14763 [Grifola frondosa]|uniref:Uncharacterized protein n=1 Tax=Grifola frondosa TaxID=5627 RepID=A0A1C7LKZ4_GRIFR|nr:hypothetical protein A0H81_14763 [Grifola frondosa]